MKSTHSTLRRTLETGSSFGVTRMPIYDTGDHLHSSVEGNKTMADNIDLRLFQR